LPDDVPNVDVGAVIDTLHVGLDDSHELAEVGLIDDKTATLVRDAVAASDLSDPLVTIVCPLSDSVPWRSATISQAQASLIEGPGTVDSENWAKTCSGFRKKIEDAMTFGDMHYFGKEALIPLRPLQPGPGEPPIVVLPDSAPGFSTADMLG
jgi:hypothetical protein